MTDEILQIRDIAPPGAAAPGVLERVDERPAPPGPVRRRGRGHEWLTLAAVAFGLMMVGLDSLVVSVANPKIGTQFHASLSGLQWVTNAYMLTFAVLLVTGGKLGDRFGRKRVFLVGTAGFVVASMLCGVSQSMGMLIAMRAVQGLFGALMMPQTLAILRATFPIDRMAQAVGIWAGASSVAIASGPIVGGLLVEHLSWRWIFFVNLPVGLISLVVGAWFVAESRDSRPPTGFDLPGLGLLSAGLLGVVWGLIQTDTHGWTSASSLTWIVVGLALLGAFVWRESSVGQRALLPTDLFRHRPLLVGFVVTLCLALAMFGMIFFLSLYLQRVQGDSPVGAGVRMLALTAVLAFSAPLGGFLVGRFGPRWPLAAGFALVAAALFGLATLGPSSPYSDIWPWFVLIGLAMGAVQTASSQAIVGGAPRDLAGVAAGLQGIGFQVGGLLGTTVLGTVVANTVTSVFRSHLVEAHVPAALATHLAPLAPAVSQGVLPIPPGAPSGLVAAVVHAGATSFTTGLDVAMAVGAGVAVFAAVISAVFMPNLDMDPQAMLEALGGG